MRLRPRLLLVVVAAAVPLVAALEWARSEMGHRAAVQGLREVVFARLDSGGEEGCGAAPAEWQDPPLRPAGPRGGGRGGGPPGDDDGRDPFPPPRGDGRPPRGPGEGPPPRPGGPGDDGGPPPRRGPDGAPPPGERATAEGFRPGPADGRRALPAPPPGAPGRVEIFGYDDDFVAANERAPRFPDAMRVPLVAGASSTDMAEDVPEGRALWVAVRGSHPEGPCAWFLARRINRGPREGMLAPLLWSLALAGGLALAIVVAAGPAVRRIRLLTGEVGRSASEGYAGTVTERGHDEIADLARAFNEAGAAVRARVAAVEERERTLREFVANTTHDVMVPLTVLQGHLAGLRDASDAGRAPDPDTLRGALEEAHYLGSLLHNLGAAARLEAGNGELQRGPVDLNALVERVAARHRTVAAARRVELDFSVPEHSVVVDGDLTLLEQAVGNVVHNAVRHNDEGGHVALRLDRTAGDRWTLRVVDDGPGIEPGEIVQITERSYRGGAARTRHPEGQGLGLHIALEVARRHGWTMTLRPRTPNGLEVEFTKAAGP